MDNDRPTVIVTEDGPYRIEGAAGVRAVDGSMLATTDPCFLCRCGGTRNPPLCDLTHGLKTWDGTETADRTAVHDVAPPAASTVSAVVDGPLEVSGVDVVGAGGRRYAVGGRLCRCGRSATKPFCDDSHLRVGFRDPVPAAAVPAYPTLYDRAGGLEALEALTRRFYDDLLAEPDPVLEPVFRGMDPHHFQHVAAWLAETFGGPPAYTEDHGGYPHMVRKHAGLALTEEQRRRWIDRMLTTADLVGLPGDPDFRSAFVAYLEWGTRIAVYNSTPGAALIEQGPVPRWGWGVSTPYVPLPWETDP